MVIREIKCKSLLNKSKIEDYCINPYVGCQHACVYCYASYYTKKYSKHTEPWGSFVDVKINAFEVLRKEILKKKKGSVYVSSLTDPYQPLEKKYELTKKCLEILLRNNFSVCVQTKSFLITRDIDLFKKFKEKCEVGLTITCFDEKVKEIFEPFSSSIKERLEALKMLKENGIKTFVFFGPVLPYISDINLGEFINAIIDLKIDTLFVDKLNLKPGIWENIQNVLKKNYPNLLERWKEILFSKSNYYENIKKKIIEICKSRINCMFCY